MDKSIRDFFDIGTGVKVPGTGIELTSFNASRHAVFAIDLGIEVDRVYISSNNEGMLKLQPVPPGFAQKRIVDLAAIHSAGAHGCFPQNCCLAVGELLWQAFESHSSDDQRRILHDALDKTKELRTRCQDQIQAVAKALLNAPGRMLSGREVMGIMRAIKKSTRG